MNIWQRKLEKENCKRFPQTGYSSRYCSLQNPAPRASLAVTIAVCGGTVSNIFVMPTTDCMTDGDGSGLKGLLLDVYLICNDIDTGH